MKVKLSQIAIPYNYVLVLPDPDFKTFQVDTHDTLLVGEKDAETAASHFSIRGKVFGLPQKLVFSLHQIRINKIPAAPNLTSDAMMFYFRSQMVENMGYKKGSVLYDVPMEVKLHDIVYFNYQEQYSCYEEARIVDTVEYGVMLLMKYDQLVCCHPEYDEAAITMLNGYLLVEPIKIETVFGSHIYEKAGILLADQTTDQKRIVKKTSIGILAHSGCHVKQFLEDSDNNEGDFDFAGGEIIVYNPKVAPPLMYALHKATLEGKELVKIRRKDIFCILPSEWSAELAGLASQLHLN